MLPSSALAHEISTVLFAIDVVTLTGAAGFCAASIVKTAEGTEAPTELIAITWNW